MLWKSQLLQTAMCSVHLAVAVTGNHFLERVGTHHVTTWGNVNRHLLTPARTLMTDQSYSSSQACLGETVCLLGTFTGAWVRSHLTAEQVPPTLVSASDSCLTENSHLQLNFCILWYFLRPCAELPMVEKAHRKEWLDSQVSA